MLKFTLCNAVHWLYKLDGKLDYLLVAIGLLLYYLDSEVTEVIVETIGRTITLSPRSHEQFRLSEPGLGYFLFLPKL